MNYSPYGFYSDDELADLPAIDSFSRNPALETQQAVRNFQVRSQQPQPMKERLAVYPGVGGIRESYYRNKDAANVPAEEWDSANTIFGRDRLASSVNRRDLAGGNSIFPSMMWGTLEGSPARLDQLREIAINNPGKELTKHIAERDRLRELYKTADPNQRTAIVQAGKTANQNIERSIGISVDNLRFNDAYTGFKPGSGFVDNEGRDIIKAGPGDASRLLGLPAGRMLNLPDPDIELATRVYDYRTQHPGSAPATMPMNVFDPAADPDIGSRLARENRAAVLLRKRSAKLFPVEDYYTNTPRDDYSVTIQHQGQPIASGQTLDEVMGDIYEAQRVGGQGTIQDVYDGDRYLDERKFTAQGAPVQLTASGEAGAGTFGRLSGQANREFGNRFTETTRRLEIGNRDMPTSDQMVQNDLNRQEYIGEFEGSRRAAPTTYLEPTFPRSDLGANAYADAPIRTDSQGNQYRALSQTRYAQNPIAEVESALKYQVLPYAGTTTMPYAARKANDYVPDFGGGNRPGYRGEFQAGFGDRLQNPQSLLAQPLPMSGERAAQIANSPDPVNQINRIESRLPRVTEYVREVMPTTTPGTIAFNRPYEPYTPTQRAERESVGQFVGEAERDYGRGLNAMRKQYDTEMNFVGNPSTLQKAEDYTAEALDRKVLGERTLTGQNFDPDELAPLAERLKMSGPNFEKNPRALTESLSYQMATDGTGPTRNYGMLQPVESLVDIINPEQSLRGIANQAIGQNLDSQRLEMGRDFTPAEQLQQDPRVLALREKAIAKQQEIDAANDLMAVRQRNQAARNPVAPTPFGMATRLSQLESARPDIADVLARAGRAGMRLR